METTWHDLKNKVAYIKIIDIREKYLFNLLKIKNSINIPYQFLLINPEDYLNKNDTYYILCEHGHKSKMISDILNKDEYKTFSIKGGILEYEKIIKEK